jgi:hypothetical protein
MLGLRPKIEPNMEVSYGFLLSKLSKNRSPGTVIFSVEINTGETSNSRFQNRKQNLHFQEYRFQHIWFLKRPICLVCHFMDFLCKSWVWRLRSSLALPIPLRITMGGKWDLVMFCCYAPLKKKKPKKVLLKGQRCVKLNGEFEKKYQKILQPPTHCRFSNNKTCMKCST